jgi:hypothetical protein
MLCNIFSVIKGLFGTALQTWSSSKKIEFLEHLFKYFHNSIFFTGAESMELYLFLAKKVRGAEVENMGGPKQM